jgi:hypothetical protein
VAPDPVVGITEDGVGTEGAVLAVKDPIVCQALLFPKMSVACMKRFFTPKKRKRPPDTVLT